MRALLPDTVGVIERDGVRVGYEVFEPLDGAAGGARRSCC
jgi:hypothetical protein